VYDGRAAAIHDALSVLSGPKGNRSGSPSTSPRYGGPDRSSTAPAFDTAIILAERAAPVDFLVSRVVRDLVGAQARRSFPSVRTPIESNRLRRPSGKYLVGPQSVHCVVVVAGA
jgi:hypothetical protein